MEKDIKGTRVCAPNIQSEKRVEKKERREEVYEHNTAVLVGGDLLLSPGQQ